MSIRQQWDDLARQECATNPSYEPLLVVLQSVFYLGAPPWEPLFHDPNGREPTGEYAIVLHNKKGGDMAEWPEDLRVREFPK